MPDILSAKEKEILEQYWGRKIGNDAFPMGNACFDDGELHALETRGFIIGPPQPTQSKSIEDLKKGRNVGVYKIAA